jgi:hypothetical protein
MSVSHHTALDPSYTALEPGNTPLLAAKERSTLGLVGPKWFDAAVDALRVFVQYQGEVYSGSLTAWRKIEGMTQGRAFGSGLVRFTRLGRDYELWFPQGSIRPANPHDESVPDEQWSADAVEKFIASLHDSD